MQPPKTAANKTTSRIGGPKCAHRGASGAGKNADCGVFGAQRGVPCCRNGGQIVARRPVVSYWLLVIGHSGVPNVFY